MGKWEVAPYAFRAMERDTDGLSLFREDFTTRKSLIKTSKKGARVAHITARQFHKLELQLRASPDQAQLPGHTLVPDMRFVKSETTEAKRKRKALEVQLAQFATENGVYSQKNQQ